VAAPLIYDDVSPGETRVFTMDFTGAINSGDSLASVSGVVMASPLSKVADPNAATVATIAAKINGNKISQPLGGASPGGFQAGALYLWVVTVATTAGEILVRYGRILCDPIT
jgi:hypothetical protein